MTKVVCQSHGIVHTSQQICPLCAALVSKRQLLAAMEAGLTLPPVPDEHHFYAESGGKIRLIGPNMGFCVMSQPKDAEESFELCTHVKFEPVSLPLVIGCRVSADHFKELYTIVDIKGDTATVRYSAQAAGTPALRIPLADLKQVEE